MKSFALINSGVVENIILANDISDISQQISGFDAAVDVTDLSEVPGPGWTYNGTVFIKPPPEIPTQEQIDREAAAVAKNVILTRIKNAPPVTNGNVNQIVQDILDYLK